MTDLTTLARMDAIGQAELVARKEVSAAELFDGYVARLEALNPLLRAVVTTADERAHPANAGPFAGVPFLAQDATPWPALRWSMGSRLFATNVAYQQTPYARRL